MSDLLKAIEFASLVLTFPTMAYAAWVTYAYRRGAIVAIRKIRQCRKSEITTSEMLQFGISANHFGMFFDNGYWGLAWTAMFLDWEIAPLIFAWGALSNVLYRQGIAGVVGASAHLHPEMIDNPMAWQIYKHVWYATPIAGLLLWVVHQSTTGVG